MTEMNIAMIDTILSLTDSGEWSGSEIEAAERFLEEIPTKPALAIVGALFSEFSEMKAKRILALMIEAQYIASLKR